MAKAKSPIEILALAYRKDACGGDDAVVSDDNTAVVERCLWKENRQQEFLRHFAIDIHPALCEASNRRIPFDRQQCSDLLVRKFEYRLCQDIDRLFLLCR